MGRRRQREPLANKIPTPTPISIQKLLYSAEASHLLTIESKLTGIAYITDGTDFVIVTERGGAIRLRTGLMRKMLEEALECVEVMS